jgi:hypothetical protein
MVFEKEMRVEPTLNEWACGSSSSSPTPSPDPITFSNFHQSLTHMHPGGAIASTVTPL